MNRSDHQVRAIAPRALRALSPPSTGRARPPTGLIVDYIDAHRQKFGVVPICRVLTEHGMPIAPSTFYDALRRRVSGPLPAQVRDEELCEHIARVHAENFSVYGA